MQDSTEPIGPWLTRQEAAAALRLHPVTLDRRIKDGTIPVRRLGGRVLIPADVVFGAD